jgi:3-oxoacyl-[acyl-carrier protein] reductase
MMNQDMSGRVALVTGAARNIGRAIALHLAAAGAKVVLAARADEAGLREGVELIEADGGKADFILTDITDEASVARMIDHTISTFGRLDILVNNAALRIETPIQDMTYAEWRAVTSVILDGSFLCARAAIPHLAKSDAGTIVNIGGMTAHTGAPNRAHVVAAKAGLVGLTRALAYELAPEGITANIVVPGSINTLRGASARGTAVRHGRNGLIGRRGEPDEIAAMVCMLAGPASCYVTGQTIHVNGGSFMA